MENWNTVFFYFIIKILQKYCCPLAQNSCITLLCLYTVCNKIILYGRFKINAKNNNRFKITEAKNIKFLSWLKVHKKL